MNINDRFYGQYQKTEENIKFYNKKTEELYEKEDVIILVNRPGSVNPNPTIIPIGDTDWISIQVFNTNKEANDFIIKNKLINKVFPEKLKRETFLMMLERLFFTGVSGVLYSFEEQSLYIPTTKLLKKEKNPLILNSYSIIIRFLNIALKKPEFLHYIYDDILTADEILMGIVKFKIEKVGNKRYADIFINRDLAEDYCLNKNINSNKNIFYDREAQKEAVADIEVLKEIGADESKENLPVTSIMNSILFHSLNISRKKVDLVRFYTPLGKYILPIEDFFKLVINVGFEQLDLR